MNFVNRVCRTAFAATNGVVPLCNWACMAARCGWACTRLHAVKFVNVGLQDFSCMPPPFTSRLSHLLRRSWAHLRNCAYARQDSAPIPFVRSGTHRPSARSVPPLAPLAYRHPRSSDALLLLLLRGGRNDEEKIHQRPPCRCIAHDTSPSRGNLCGANCIH